MYNMVGIFALRINGVYLQRFIFWTAGHTPGAAFVHLLTDHKSHIAYYQQYDVANKQLLLQTFVIILVLRNHLSE